MFKCFRGRGEYPTVVLSTNSAGARHRYRLRLIIRCLLPTDWSPIRWTRAPDKMSITPKLGCPSYRSVNEKCFFLFFTFFFRRIFMSKTNKKYINRPLYDTCRLYAPSTKFGPVKRNCKMSESKPLPPGNGFY